MELLAKSKPRESDALAPTVVEHSCSVCEAAEMIFLLVKNDLSVSLGLDVLHVEHLRMMCRAATLLHDFAKVNSSFQAMLHSKPSEAASQPVRHEILAAWLLSDPDFLGSWFASLRHEDEIWPVIWAVAGHHLKMSDPAHDEALFNTGSGTRILSIPLSRLEVGHLLAKAAKAIGTATIPRSLADVQLETVDDTDNGLEQRIADFADRSYRTWKRLQQHPQVIPFTALLKALLISADVAGSALIATGESPSEWVPHALSIRLTSEVLTPIIKKGTKGKPPLKFQENVRDSNKLATIVIAGCGNGKTTAAYLWAQRYAVGRKLWFTYPTTGTASAGYQGYLYDHPDLRALLMHGRAEVDMQAIRGTPEDDSKEECLRLESLRAWNHQVIACTADTVLGLLQNQRRPLFSFPAIAAGAFVFDEIHSYDARMFGSLLRFLKTFPGAPVLLMSASIPPRRLEALREALGDRIGDAILGDQAMEGYERYCLQPRESAPACQQQVVDAMKAEKKVIWVCNTVADAVKTAQAARQWSGIAPERIIVYHSRFRYRDRVERQKQVIAEFAYYTEGRQKGQRIVPGPCLVVATQVCEMSLDISADLMVTAECPLPSLVQRLGRLNRYAQSDDPWHCLIYPFQGDPYNEKIEDIQTRGDHRVGMAAARQAVTELTGKPCSQRHLAECLDKMIVAEEFEEYSAWLDDGWLTTPAQLRDGGNTITLIREEDLTDIEDELGLRYAKPSQWTAAKLVPWTIPMLYPRRFQPVDHIGGYPVAPQGSITYSEVEGAAWASEN
jgi:CRISPR-associated endonuclease/helicase Cas3